MFGAANFPIDAVGVKFSVYEVCRNLEQHLVATRADSVLVNPSLFRIAAIAIIIVCALVTTCTATLHRNLTLINQK